MLELVVGEVVEFPDAVTENAVEPVAVTVVELEIEGEPDRDVERETKADAVALFVLLVDFVTATVTVVDADDVDDNDPETEGVHDTEKVDVRDVRHDVDSDTVDDGEGVTLLDTSALFDAQLDFDTDADAVVLKDCELVTRTEGVAPIVAEAVELLVKVTVMPAELDFRAVDVAVAVDDAFHVLDIELVGVTEDVDDLLAEFDAETVRVVATVCVAAVADDEKLTGCDGVPIRDGTSDFVGALVCELVTLLVTVVVTGAVLDAEMLGMAESLPDALGDTDRVMGPVSVPDIVDEAVDVAEPDTVDVLVADAVFVDLTEVESTEETTCDAVKRGVTDMDAVPTPDLELTTDFVPVNEGKTVEVVALEAVVVVFIVAVLVVLTVTEFTDETL